MALEVIGAGLGRNATMSTKFALEALGYDPCYHMVELLSNARTHVGLWEDVVDGNPDWDAIFADYKATTDYPACTYWRELADHYPQAKVILTVRDPDSWFDSVSETIFSPGLRASLSGAPMEKFMMGTVFAAFGDKVTDRAFMTDWYVRRNEEVVDTIAPERLLIFHPRDGWEPLCAFLGKPVPDFGFPTVNSRDEIGATSDEKGGLPPDLATLEAMSRQYNAAMREKAFA